MLSIPPTLIRRRAGGFSPARRITGTGTGAGAGAGAGFGQSDTEDSGPGLAIVKEICLAHRGRIALADGRDGKGATVEVALPSMTR